ncbi:protein kinase domain-containing protein [Aliinostoc sp. HNIBRCY26]|uniref:protein kinase domain-containing protein n=1 Tax=Aliinostoc sp. HNIBRCY26 TaxID=3418997 RepID=UPI003D0015BC
MVWNPGKQLFGRRYIIEKKLGEGGMGITYLAKNLQGELRVIKTLSNTILNNRDLKKHLTKIKQDFKEEALRLALCRHSYIVEIETVFDEGDLPCMAMEYIKGEDLNKLITKKGALPEAEALQYIQQIGEALKLVHEKGLLHRDLKPGNIMLRADKPEVVLIDFGLARQFIPDKVLHHTEAWTPGYAPPEQYVNEAERGEYIDVYALAATLYSLLTGQFPMQAPARLLNDRLKPPKYFKPTVSDRVNKAVMKGMKLKYKLRPKSVQEFLDLLGAGIVASTQSVKSPVNTTPSWECAHIIPGISGKIALSPKGDILANVAGKVIHLFSSTTGELLRTLTGHIWRVESLAISSDGQFLASTSISDLQLWDVATGTEIRRLSGSVPSCGLVAISSDGQLLASTISRDIKLWDVATGREIRTLSGHSKSVNSVAISSDGQLLANGSDDKTIKLWNVATGREIRTLTGHSNSVNSVAISNDGQFLVSGGVYNAIKLWNVQTGKEICTLSHFNSVCSVAFSPDGNLLAAGDYSGNIKIWRRS